MEHITFQYYPKQIKSNNPLGFVTLQEFINGQKNPKDSIKELFHRIQQAELDGNKKLKAELKQNNLHYFTPCAVVSELRRYTNITRFTGLMMLDFDHIDNASELKEYLFGEYKCIIAAWLSPSMKGVRCVVRIPVVQTVDAFKEYFFGIAAELDQFTGFDTSCQNAVLPLFQSYDADLLSRDDYETWTTKGVKLTNFSVAPTIPPAYLQITEKDKQTCVKMIESGFTHITNCGHPPLRSLCISIGGYVASGYLQDWEALQIIDYQIETHNYLKKGIPGYKKTARWALNLGKNKPLTIKHD